jgi:hypothetical protein
LSYEDERLLLSSYFLTWLEAKDDFSLLECSSIKIGRLLSYYLFLFPLPNLKLSKDKTNIKIW